MHRSNHPQNVFDYLNSRSPFLSSLNACPVTPNNLVSNLLCEEEKKKKRRGKIIILFFHKKKKKKESELKLLSFLSSLPSSLPFSPPLLSPLSLPPSLSPFPLPGGKRFPAGSRPPEDFKLSLNKKKTPQNFQSTSSDVSERARQAEQRWLRIVQNDLENIPFGLCFLFVVVVIVVIIIVVVVIVIVVGDCGVSPIYPRTHSPSLGLILAWSGLLCGGSCLHTCFVIAFTVARYCFCFVLFCFFVFLLAMIDYLTLLLL